MGALRMKMITEAISNGQMANIGPLVADHPMTGMSDKYGFVSTRMLVDLIMKHGFVPVSCQVSGATGERIGFQKHRIAFELPGSPVALDGTRLRLTLINSHDRSSAAHLYLGWYRALCENGLIVGDSLSEPIKVYHIGGPRLAVTLNEALITALERIPKITEVFKSWNAARLDTCQRRVLVQRLQGALYDTGQGEYGDLYVPQRAGDTPQTLWNVFNVLQETVIKGNTQRVSVSALNGQRRFIKARSIKAIDRNTKVNRLIFDVCNQYAKESGLTL